MQQCFVSGQQSYHPDRDWDVVTNHLLVDRSGKSEHRHLVIELGKAVSHAVIVRRTTESMQTATTDPVEFSLHFKIIKLGNTVWLFCI